MTWGEFWAKNVDTLGVTLFFAFGGSGFLLWTNDKGPPSAGRALMVIVAGQFVGCTATAACFGYLGWSLFTAPLVGAVCGLVGLPVLIAATKIGQRVQDRAPDIGDAGIDIATRRLRKEPE